MTVADLVSSVLGPDVPIAVRAYDGSRLGPPGARDARSALARCVAPNRHRSRRARLRPRVRGRRPRCRRRHLPGARAAPPPPECRAHSDRSGSRSPRSSDRRPSVRSASSRRGPAAGPAALAGPRRGRDRAPLQRLQRVLPAPPRTFAHLFVCGVGRPRCRTRGGAGREARSRVPEARAAPRHAPARRRLRVGEHVAARGAALRGARRGRHAVERAGRPGVEADRRGRARRPRHGEGAGLPRRR